MQIYQQFKDSPETQGFLGKIEEFESRVDFAKVATLFLVLRNRYKDDFKYEENIISCKKFGFEFELAAYLLGYQVQFADLYLRFETTQHWCRENDISDRAKASDKDFHTKSLQ